MLSLTLEVQGVLKGLTPGQLPGDCKPTTTSAATFSRGQTAHQSQFLTGDRTTYTARQAMHPCDYGNIDRHVLYYVDLFAVQHIFKAKLIFNTRSGEQVRGCCPWGDNRNWGFQNLLIYSILIKSNDNLGLHYNPDTHILYDVFLSKVKVWFFAQVQSYGFVLIFLNKLITFLIKDWLRSSIHTKISPICPSTS